MLKKNIRYDKPFMANAGCLISESKPDNIANIDQLDASDGFDSSKESSLGNYEEEFEEEEKQNKEMTEKSPGDYAESNVSYSEATSGPGIDPRKRSTIGLKNNSLLATKNSAKKIQTQLYVLPCFLKPGKHNMVIQANLPLHVLEQSTHSNYGLSTKSPGAGLNSLKSNEMVEQFFHHEITAPLRQEEVKLYVKQLGRKHTEVRQFDVSQTVFRDWKQPTDADFANMIEHDK